MRDSFVFYRSFFESISELDPEDQIVLFDAICRYALDGENPEVRGPAKAVFIAIKPQLDANTRRYENGKKGGAPSGNQNARKQPKNNLKTTKAEPNDNDNVNANSNVNENVYVNGNASHTILYGRFKNVEISGQEYFMLKQEFEKVTELINKVSVWLRQTGNEVPDHYALCIKFAESDNWPKRKKIEPVQLPEVTDPISEEEQDAKMAEMRARLNGAFTPKGGN